MGPLMVLAILGWIALGCFGVKWCAESQRQDTDTLFIVGLLVYFGAPLLLMSVVGGLR